MELELSRLSANDTPIHGEVMLADPDATLAEDGIRFPEPFRIDGAARLQRGQVLVTGHVEGVIELECGRCLGRVRQPVKLDFEARHAEASSAPKPPAPRAAAAKTGHAKRQEEEDEGIRLAREDLDVSYLPPGATTIRIDDVVREQVLLEVPLRPLCRPDCKGLCPRCGADLNAGDCGCAKDEVHDVRLAGLAALKAKLERGSGSKKND